MSLLPNITTKIQKKHIHSVIQGPNPPEKLTPPLTEKPSIPDCSILNPPPQFCHLKLVESPITTFLFLRFSDVFREYKNVALDINGLKQ